MPCSCQIPVELYPDATEWGPLLWTVLHCLAEHSGKAITPLYQEDERRAWLSFFKLTGDIIPCSMCKRHFEEYIKEHPIEQLRTIPYSALHDWIRLWFWEVHNWVNDTLSKPDFPLANLTATYASIKIRPVINSLEIPMKKAILISGNNYKKFLEWKSKAILLLSILGI